MTLRVQFKRACTTPGFIVLVAMWSAQPRAHPCDQLPRRKRLGHIIICAEFKAQNPIDLLGAGGQKNHRHITEHSEFSANIESVDIGESDVEQNDVNSTLSQPGQNIPPQQAMLDI